MDPSDDRQFAELVATFGERGRLACRRFRIPAEDAEDLLQQSLLQYLRAKPPSTVPALPWLLVALRRCCLMYWRSRRRSIYVALDTNIMEALSDPSEARRIEREAVREAVHEALGRVSPPCRSVLATRYGPDGTAQKAAEHCGYAASGIYKVIERCLAALSGALVRCGFPLGREEAGSR